MSRTRKLRTLAYAFCVPGLPLSNSFSYDMCRERGEGSAVCNWPAEKGFHDTDEGVLVAGKSKVLGSYEPSETSLSVFGPGVWQTLGNILPFSPEDNCMDPTPCIFTYPFSKGEELGRSFQSTAVGFAYKWLCACLKTVNVTPVYYREVIPSTVKFL